MKYLLLLLISTIFIVTESLFAQCDINTSASSTTITCGQSVNLSAFGSSTGQMVLNETFNTGAFGPGWGSTPGSTNFNNPCSPGGVDGTPHAWMGSSTSVPRTLTSAPYNLTAATAGVSICFDLLFAEQGDAAPCEGPDEPDEGVYLQYSINGGATWIDIHYFDPNGGNDPQLTNWNNWCFALPAAAITSNTLIRWHQTADSGADYDHWGIDNVQIFQNDINAEVIWLHDGYSYGVGNPGGVNPTAVTPTTTTTYTAQITTGTGQICTSNITIVVTDPVYDVNVSANPTTLCPGECSTISGTGRIVLDPGGVETYENNEFSVVASGSASVNINVQGINTSSITNGLIQNVTINGFSFSGSFFCTSFGGCNCNGTNIGFGSTCNLTASGFTVTLTSPGGCSIILAPAGAASGNYNSTVFVPVGGTNIGPGFPNGGPWNPNQPFSTLNGCDPNGVWTLSFNAPGLGLGFGTLQGWSITFNDPPIYAPVNYSWSPTTGLSNPNSINTQACPSATTNYVLTVSNGTPGCATHTENINLIVNPCNGCIPPAVTVNPITTCAPATVNLATAIASGSAPATLSYHATQANAQNDVSPISTTVSTSGTYWVRYEDPNDPACFGTAQITVTINPADNPAFTLTNFCPGGTNQATGIATPGGTFSFNPAPTGSATINAATGSISNATAGTTYTVQYTTNGTCPASSTQTVTATSFTFTAAATPENCGNADGEITITPNGGTPAYTYSINGGTAQNSATFSGLTTGSYTILVTDNSGCQSTGSQSVGSIGGPSIDNMQTVNPTCGAGCNGSITATVSGGNPPYTYQWYDASNNPIGTNSATISNLCGGTYSLQVTDVNGGSSNQLFSEDFENGASNWTLNVSTGTEGADPNYFEVDDDEGGVAPGGCGVAGNGDATLHITSVFNPSGGAAYDAGGLCGLLFCPQTNRQAESPSINTTGQSNLTLQFDYIAQGDAPNDQATVWYNTGSGWTQLGGALFSGTGACTPQGLWSAYSAALPASCENIPNLRIAIRWTNNDDGVGTDPSVAINNFAVVTSSGGSGCPAVEFATLTGPGSIDDASFTLTNYCQGSPNSATGIVTPGGTFAFNPVPTDGATINAATGTITNGTGGTTYTVQYTTNGACPDSETQTITVNSLPTPSISGNLSYCTGSQTTLSTGGPYASYSWSTGASAQTITSTAQNGITVTVIDMNGCQGTSPAVNVTEVSQIVTNSTVSVCQGQSISIHGVPQTTAGVYSQTFNASGGCDSISNVTLVVNPNPTPVISGNLWYCEGNQATLSAGGPYASYSWNIGGNQQTVQTTSSSPITVTVTDANGCSGTSAPVSLTAPPIAVVHANPSSGIAPLVVNLTNGSQNANTYFWDFGNGFQLNTANSGGHTQTYDSIGQYVVMLVASQNGCSDTAYVTITVVEPAMPMVIEFPNIFTPNGDHNNDFFEFASSNVATLEVIVTNRWGNFMFKSTDVHFKWDGTMSNGDPASEGVYFYQYKVTGVLGEQLEGQKFVQLFR